MYLSHIKISCMGNQAQLGIIVEIIIERTLIIYLWNMYKKVNTEVLVLWLYNSYILYFESVLYASNCRKIIWIDAYIHSETLEGSLLLC